MGYESTASFKWAYLRKNKQAVIVSRRWVFSFPEDWLTKTNEVNIELAFVSLTQT